MPEADQFGLKNLGCGCNGLKSVIDISFLPAAAQYTKFCGLNELSRLSIADIKAN